MSKQADACAAYFRSRPGCRRILTELLKKYRSFGRPAGYIDLPDATAEECDVVRGIFGRPFYPPLRFRTAQFEKELQVAFPGVSLKEALEIYFGTEIKTKHELRETQDSRFSAMLLEAAGEAGGETSSRWLRALEEQHTGGYILLRREATRCFDGTRDGLICACRGMDRLEQKPKGLVRLAVLSAGATSNPHALDSGTLSGKLFLYLLAFRSGQEFPENAEQRDSLYYENGIICDSISSMVTQIGLILDAEAGEHPAYRLFRQRRELCTLSLASLSELTGAHSPSGRVYIVENEMVFAQLCDRSGRFCSPLICTSGQPSVAALRLLDMLAADGVELYYSGDFDGKGLTIALQLCARYPHLLKLWHMTPADYDLCRSEVPLSEVSQSLLGKCSGTALEAAAQAVKQYGCAGYQELLLSWLEADLTK